MGKGRDHIYCFGKNGTNGCNYYKF